MHTHKALLCILIPCLALSAKPIIVPGYTAYADRYNRLSSAPFISGDTFRSFADHIIDDTKIPFDPDTVQAGDIIFVFTSYLPYFFKKIHPLIQSPYILISHNSDSCAPGLIDFNGILKDEPYPVDLCTVIAKSPDTRNFSAYLDDEKIIAWLSENPNAIHEKLIPIPIGLANRYWPHGNISIFDQVLQKISGVKKHFLYLNVAANTIERSHIADLFKESNFVYNSGKKPLPDYLLDLSESIFVLSPPGGGIDCHRTWEALYMGAIPIVRSSCLDILFQDLPVVIINQWEEVNEQLLIDQLNQLKNKKLDLHKLSAAYWYDRIANIKKIYLHKGPL